MLKKTLLFILAGLGVLSMVPSPHVRAQPAGGEQFSCSADDIAATLTLLTGCTAPQNNLRRFVTDIVAQSTTSTGGTFNLRSGTSVASGGAANCATATVTLIPSAASAARLSAPANTAAATAINFTTPLIVASNRDLCVLGVATNTTSIQITGYVAP